MARPLAFAYPADPYAYAASEHQFLLGFSLDLAAPVEATSGHRGSGVLPLLRSLLASPAGLMVAPVVEPGQVDRAVYLPAGSGFWLDAENLTRIGIGPALPAVDAPLDHIPVLVPAGLILVKQQPLATTQASRQGVYSLAVALNGLPWDNAGSSPGRNRSTEARVLDRLGA